MLTITIPASTSNLGAGFDVFGLALKLYLKIQIEKRGDGGKELRFTGEGSASIESGESQNFITATMDRMFTTRGLKAPGYTMKVHNEIPLSRGLGSSGTAILGGIICANYLGGFNLSEREILESALKVEGHPDNISPSLMGGLTATLQLEDGTVRLLKRRFPTDISLVFVIPEFNVSTAKARAILPDKYRITDIRYNLQRASLMFETILTGEYEMLSHVLNDRLHQPYRAELVPGLKEALSLGPEEGLIGQFISGSGPTVCAFTTGNSGEIGARISQIFSGRNIKSSVFILKAENRGTIVKPKNNNGQP